MSDGKCLSERDFNKLEAILDNCYDVGAKEEMEKLPVCK